MNREQIPNNYQPHEEVERMLQHGRELIRPVDIVITMGTAMRFRNSLTGAMVYPPELDRAETYKDILEKLPKGGIAIEEVALPFTYREIDALRFATRGHFFDGEINFTGRNRDFAEWMKVQFENLLDMHKQYVDGGGMINHALVEEFENGLEDVTRLLDLGMLPPW